MTNEVYKSLNDLNAASSQRIVIMRIKRIIEKYSEVWRVLHEPIQNSMDAIQKCQLVDKEGEVHVKIGLGSSKVIIEDNGKGFPHDFNLLLPDGTDKTAQFDTMGYQGVGLKSVIYSSNQFKLRSRLENDEVWSIKVENGSKYLKTEGEIEAPIIVLNDPRTLRGTTIEVGFDRGVVIKAIEQIIETITTSESNFKWRWEKEEILRANIHLKGANDLQVFQYMCEYYLRTQTYIGSVNRLLNCRLEPTKELYAKPVKVTVDINFDDVDIQMTDNEFLKRVIKLISKKSQKILTISIDNKFIDFQEIVKQQQQQKPRSIAFEIYDFNIKRAGIEKNPTLKDQIYCKIMTPDYRRNEDDFEHRFAQYISLLNGTSPQRMKRNVRIFKDLFPRILGIYILIGRLEYYEQFLGNNFGIKFIAANGVPTQHELTPRSSNQSFYFNPVTFILNIDAKLNEGKTHLIDDSLQRKCVKFFREAFESTLNRLAKEFVRTIPNDDPGDSETDFTETESISITGVDIKRTPNDENTLIALFYQLLKIQDLELPTYGLLSQGIFDGKFTYDDRVVRSDNDLLNLEFKVKLSALLNDFDNPNSPKQFDRCNLIIVWDDYISSTQQQDWRVIDRGAVPTKVLGSSNIPDWIDTVLKDVNHNYIPIIIVKDWVVELDPEFT